MNIREPAHVPIAKSDVHLWHADLDAIAARRRWIDFLSPEEKSRADNLRFELPRRRFITARGLLRELIGSYTHTAPAQLHFGYGAHGKPFLISYEATPFFFNISHCGGQALFAFASGGEVGVDIERRRANFDLRALESAFTPQEKHALSSRDARRIFKIWTRKEAFFKADGRGLSLPFNQCDVSDFEPSDEWDRAKRWCAQSQTWREDARWNLRSLPCNDEHEAALATQNLQNVRCLHWNG